MQFAQIFSLLMALSGFGIDANPKAATADQVLEHSVDDADFVMHFDVAAVVPRNFKALTDLPNDPAIKGNRELVDITKSIAAQAQQGRAMVKGMVGFDPITDVDSVTLFAKFKPGSDDPDVLIDVRGNLPPDLISKISKATGAPMEVFGGRSGLVVDKFYLGVAKSGDLLFGTTAWVKPRLADTWKAPTRPANSHGARFAALLDEKPFLAYSFSPSATTLKMMEKGGDNPFIALFKDLDLAVASFRTDGIVWATYSKTTKGFENAALAADGAIDLMRACQIAPRGFAKLAVAYLDVYAGKSKEIDELIKHKNDILKIVEQYTGDGQFKATIDKDPKSKGVVVHAIGKHLSEVLPFGLAIPAGAVAWLTVSGRSSVMVQPVTSSAPATLKPAKPAPAHAH
jgi:hypothetical protein